MQNSKSLDNFQSKTYSTIILFHDFDASEDRFEEKKAQENEFLNCPAKNPNLLKNSDI